MSDPSDRAEHPAPAVEYSVADHIANVLSDMAAAQGALEAGTGPTVYPIARADRLGWKRADYGIAIPWKE